MFVELILSGALLGGAERAVLDEVNAHRRALGLAELAWSDPAAAEARRHCSAILSGAAREPHSGFEKRAARLERMNGASTVAENVLLVEGRSFSPRDAVARWLASSGHRRSIEGPYALSGVGISGRNGRVCAVQIFLGR